MMKVQRSIVYTVHCSTVCSINELFMPLFENFVWNEVQTIAVLYVALLVEVLYI